MVNFRDYQLKIIDKGYEIITRSCFLYLSMEVRTGKTLTSLGIAVKLNPKNVLFLTKKKAISSISNDFALMGVDYDVINYESMHKLPKKKWDVVILDESHSCGAYPKPSKRAKDVKSLLTKHSPYVIMLSGTPTPESYSQMYHQVYGIKGNPFSGYKNFYRFCDDHVILSTRKIGGYNVNDYSNGKESILELMKPYMISFTQEQAGFSSRIDEEILTVNVSDEIKSICSKLKKDRIAYVGDEVILGDTGVKLMSKLHQLYSGTVKFESGNSMVLDTSKADYIKWKFTGNKVGIFYKFTAELEALKSVFNDDITTDLDEFNSTDKHIALQIVSGREGISLKNADFIVFYNIDFSATSYWQARDRMTTIDRSYNKVYWIFSDKGIESKIHRTVLGKKNFTLNHFYND